MKSSRDEVGGEPREEVRGAGRPGRLERDDALEPARALRSERFGRDRGLRRNSAPDPRSTHRCPRADRTTVLHPGDHKFFKHDSHIEYRQAKIVSAMDLERLLQEGRARPMDKMENNVFTRICDGILKSPFTPMDVREMYNNHLYHN